MQTRQVAIPLVAGTIGVEVRDAVDGWVERVLVETDGRTIVHGVPEREITIEPQTAGSPEDAIAFRRAVAASAHATTDLDRALALRDWVARRAERRSDGTDEIVRVQQIPKDAPIAYSPQGHDVLAQIDRGYRYNCLSLTTILLDACRVAGLHARRVDLATRHESPYEGHSIVEVWPRELGRWVVMDSTFCATFTVDGVPASALEIHRAVVDRRFDRIRVIRDAAAPGIDPWDYPQNPLLYFRNVFRALPEGGLLALWDSKTPVGPVGRGGVTPIESEDAFSNPPGVPVRVRIRRGESNGHIVFQIVGETLYVCLRDDLFSYGRHFVRTSPNAVASFTPEVRSYDLDDPSICTPGEVVPNPALADRDRDLAPDMWTFEGAPLRVARRADGALILESGESSCDLVSPIAIEPGTPYVLAARLEVTRGQVSVGVRRRAHLRALVEPGPARTVSPIVMILGRRRTRVRVHLEPNTRCVVEWVSARQALTMRDALGGLK